MSSPRTLLLATLLGWLLLAPATAAAQQDCLKSGVAVIRVSAVLASIPRYADTLSANLAVTFDAYKVDATRLQGLRDSAAKAYREKSALISPAARQVEVRKLDAQNAQIDQQLAALRQRVTQQREAMLGPTERGVQAVIDSVRRDLHCPLLFDVGSGSGLASANKSIDLTDRVIARIRSTGDTALFGPHDPKTTGRP